MALIHLCLPPSQFHSLSPSFGSEQDLLNCSLTHSVTRLRAIGHCGNSREFGKCADLARGDGVHKRKIWHTGSQVYFSLSFQLHERSDNIARTANTHTPACPDKFQSTNWCKTSRGSDQAAP